MAMCLSVRWKKDRRLQFSLALFSGRRSIKLVQDIRDNNRSQAIPAGDGPSRPRRKPTEKKSQRSLNGDDMLDALKALQSRSGEIFGKSK
ncbi:TPA: hypothetical protein ACH262_005381, partial [Klebsiella variicola subsp. variicola]